MQNPLQEYLDGVIKHLNESREAFLESLKEIEIQEDAQDIIDDELSKYKYASTQAELEIRAALRSTDRLKGLITKYRK